LGGQEKKFEKVELRIIISGDTPDIYFCHEGHHYVTINMFCESIEHMIGEWQESIAPHAALGIVTGSQGDKRHFQIKFRQNGLTARESAILGQIAQEANAAIRAGQSATIDLTSKMNELHIVGWEIYFSEYSSEYP
jgi:hypothetical protein